jgi:hypothetical protein
LLHRQIVGLFALWNAIDVLGRAAVHLVEVNTISHRSAVVGAGSNSAISFWLAAAMQICASRHVSERHRMSTVLDLPDSSL